MYFAPKKNSFKLISISKFIQLDLKTCFVFVCVCVCVCVCVEGRKVETVTLFLFLGSKMTAAMKSEDTRKL